MSIGIITDEVAQDLETVGKFVKEFSINNIEIRSINGRSPFDYTEEDVLSLLAFKEDYGVTVSTIASPLFKCDMYDKDTVKQHEDAFKKLCITANKLGAKYIRAFDFFKNDAPMNERVDMFKNVIATANEYGITLGIETEPSANSYDADTLAEFLKAVNNKTVGAVYDPGNEVWANGTVDGEGYEKLKDFIVEFHIKDAKLIDGKPEAVKIGTGVADFPMLFEKLKKDNFSGPMLLETHYRLGIELTEEQLLSPGGYEFSNGAYEASAECMKILKEMW